MAIAFRAGATGPSSNSATTYTMSLPAGLADGDVVLAISPHTGGTLPTVPAGWTAIGNGKSNHAAGYKVWHTGDSTSVTLTDTTGTWWQGVCVAYSGCDASNPVDDVAVHVARGDLVFNIPLNVYRAPSLVPNWNNEVAVALYGRDSSTAGGSWPAPSGWTSRQTSTGGPGVGIFDKALTGGTETGNADVAHLLQGGTWEFGATVLLRPASATTASHSPTISQVAVSAFNANFSTGTPDLNALGVQDGDMVLVSFTAGNTISTAPTGYTLQASDTGITLYTHTWHTGDTTSPSWVFTASQFRTYIVVLLRTKGGTGPVAFDVVAHTNGASGSVTSPSLTPASTNEFLACFFGDQNTAGEAITTPPAGLTNDVLGTFGPTAAYGFKRGITSATGGFSTTFSTTRTLGANAVLFEPQAPAPISVQKQLAVTIVS